MEQKKSIKADKSSNKKNNNANKKSIVKILIIIVIILLLLLGAVLVYIATDLFKTEKTAFFKYLTQIGNQENGFFENNIVQYYNNLENRPHQNEGKISINATGPEDEQENYEMLKNFNISFSGQTDRANNKANQNISINYNENVNFEFGYKQIEDIYGLQSEYVSPKYITVDINNTENFENTNVVSLIQLIEGFKNLETLKEIPFSQEEIASLWQNAVAIINNKLSEDKFSKVEEDGQTGYKLSITGEDLQNIAVQLLEALKNDENTLNKVNEYIKKQKNSASITATTINNYIKEIQQNTSIKSQNFEITIYKTMGKANRILITTGEYKIQLKKEKSETLNYELSCEQTTQDGTTTKYSLVADYSGLDSMQNVKETYKIGFEASDSEQQGTMEYQFENQVSFIESATIEDFDDENSLLLSDYDKEQVESFLQAVDERLQEVNKQKMEELGVSENENPLNTILGMGAYSYVINSTDTTAQMTELEINSFNQEFEVYEGTNLQGQTVRGLLSTILNNNQSEDAIALIKEINFNGEEYDAGEQNITFIKEDIDTQKSYRVEFERDQETGIIYRAVINEK